MRTPKARLTGAAVLALTVAACTASETGSAGNLTFTYDTDDPAVRFDQPIAIGAQIDLRVQDPLTSTTVPITGVRFEDEGVLELVSIDSGRATLRGIGEGTTIVEVTATLRDESVSDSISVSAAPARVTALRNGCADEATGVYLARSRLQIPFELESAPGQPVIGYGLYPFELAPASTLSLDVDDRSMQYLAVRTGEHASRGTIVSTLDDTQLVLDIVEEGSIDGARLRLGGNDGVGIDQTRYVLAQPTVGALVLCQGTPAFEVIERSVAICRAHAVARLHSDDEVGRTFGWVQVDGVTQGVCRFDVRYPNARGGAGLTMPFSMSVR